MSPALNRSSAIWCFKHSNAIEMHDGITFDNILPDGNCKVVKCVVFFYLDTKLWAGHRKGGRNHERKCRIPRISPPLRFILRLRLQKGGRTCGTLRYIFYIYIYVWYMHIVYILPYLCVVQYLHIARYGWAAQD